MLVLAWSKEIQLAWFLVDLKLKDGNIRGLERFSTKRTSSVAEIWVNINTDTLVKLF